MTNSPHSNVAVLKQMVNNREDSVYLAKLAEQAERYEGELLQLN